MLKSENSKNYKGEKETEISIGGGEQGKKKKGR